jgi:hypothetical protein
MEISGRQKTDLNKVWKDGAEAYLGISMPNFPNLFMLYGPNTNLGHNSIIYMIECQVNYVISAVKAMAAGNLKTVDVKASKMDEFVDYLKARLSTSVWEKECDSWYKNEAGKVTNNWPDFTYVYEQATRKVDLDDYDVSPAPNHAAE